MNFLGRLLDPRTMTYSYPDGAGGILPSEMRLDVMEAAEQYTPAGGNGIFVLGKIWEWKKRLGIDT